MSPKLSVGRRLLPVVAMLAIAASAVLPVSGAAPATALAMPAPVAPVVITAGGAVTAGAAPDATADLAAELRLQRRATGLAAPAARPVLHDPGAHLLLARSTRARIVPSAIAVPAAPVISELKAVAPVRRAPSAAPAAPVRRSTPSGTRSTASVALAPNRVSIPALGINRAVSPFPCSRSQPPGHVVYRWGCAGANNVYLFAHASSQFKPLHDLYTSGRLRAGLRVVYADGRGNVRTYAVQYWRVVKPDGDIEWAYAAQSQPSMTLQTCLGANSEWRLVLRLVAVG